MDRIKNKKEYGSFLFYLKLGFVEKCFAGLHHEKKGKLNMREDSVIMVDVPTSIASRFGRPLPFSTLVDLNMLKKRRWNKNAMGNGNFPYIQP